MSTRAHTTAAIATFLMLASASQVAAQITIPTRAHETLSLELKSLRDNITLYKGDPQQLLLMSVNPDRFRPRVEYTSNANALLQIRDLYLFENPKYSTLPPEERDKEEGPVAEEWEIRLCPSGPTDFSLECERGESTLDFTDFEVRSVYIQADRTKVDVEFARQNPIVLESFTAHVPAGSFQFRKMLHARAKAMTLFVSDAACQFEITGKEFDGESTINFEGVPAEMQLAVSRKIGVRVTAPAATAARFAAPHVTQTGEDWVSQGYETATCRIRLTFAEEIPSLKVVWK
jgi:hypothetical protein